MILLDECIQEEICAALRLLDIGATDVRYEQLQGSSDKDLVAATRRLRAIFVTYDLDFTTRPLVAAMSEEGICVVLIRRSKDADLAEVAEAILRYRKQWPDQCGTEPTIISCSLRRGCRPRRVSDLPYHMRLE